MTSRRKRTRTLAQVREQMAGARPLAPGVWLDRDGYLHFSVPEMLKHLGWPDTVDNRALVNAVVAEMIAELHPDATIVETDLES